MPVGFESEPVSPEPEPLKVQSNSRVIQKKSSKLTVLILSLFLVLGGLLGGGIVYKETRAEYNPNEQLWDPNCKFLGSRVPIEVDTEPHLTVMAYQNDSVEVSVTFTNKSTTNVVDISKYTIVSTDFKGKKKVFDGEKYWNQGVKPEYWQTVDLGVPPGYVELFDNQGNRKGCWN